MTLSFRPVRTKSDLGALLPAAAPTAACEKAIAEGRFIVLGGFTPPGAFPQWVARVESPFGRSWYVGIAVDEAARRYVPVSYHADNSLPWANWDGDSKGTRVLIDGEEPVKSAMKRMEARRGYT